MVNVVTDATFDQEVLKSELPVVVDFFAVWCGPCKMLAPILEQLAQDFEGKVTFAKIDIDQNRVPENYQIQAVPTLKFFKDGKIAGESIGLVSAEDLKEKIQSLL